MVHAEEIKMDENNEEGFSALFYIMLIIGFIGLLGMLGVLGLGSGI